MIGCLLGNHRYLLCHPPPPFEIHVTVTCPYPFPPTSLQQHNVRQYWLPVTCHLIPDAFHVMLKPIRSAVLRQQGLEDTPPCEETQETWEACPPVKYREEKESVVLIIQEAPFGLLLHALLALLRVGREHNLVDLALLVCVLSVSCVCMVQLPIFGFRRTMRMHCLWA